MESGRFLEFFRNAPFDKRSVLRGFRGFRPHFFMTHGTHLWKGIFGDYPGVERQEPIRERKGLMGCWITIFPDKKEISYF